MNYIFEGKKTHEELLCALVLLASLFEFRCSDSTYNVCYASFLCTEKAAW